MKYFWNLLKIFIFQKTMLGVKKSADVAQEVNLRNSLHSGEEEYKWGIHLGFETRSGHHQKFKTGASVTPQKGLMPSKIKKRNMELSLC